MNNKKYWQTLIVEISLQVLLAMHGNTGRSITSKWLQKNGACTLEVSEWNELTQILRELFHASSVHHIGFDAHHAVNMSWKSKLLNIEEIKNPTFVIIVDIGLLDLSTEIWKEQINFLHKYFGRAKFAWVLNNDTSNTIKMELRRKGHILMVNKPLYKTKVFHILEAVIEERNLELQKRNMTASRTIVKESDAHEFLEIDSTQFDGASSDGSDISEMCASNNSNGEKQKEKIVNSLPLSQYNKSNYFVGLTDEYTEDNISRKEESCKSSPNCCEIPEDTGQKLQATFPEEAQGNDSGPEKTFSVTCSRKTVNDKKSLEGLRILLAEDTPVLQRVATIMLEKMGATVVAVGDGQQAVDALNCMLGSEDSRRGSLMKERSTISQTEIISSTPYDLVLMDCQVMIIKHYL